MRPTIYAAPLDGETKGMRMSFFYLHGIAEQVNGFDICHGNLAAFRLAMRQGKFECKLVIKGKEYIGMCFSKFDGERMVGIVTLANDTRANEQIKIEEFYKSMI